MNQRTCVWGLCLMAGLAVPAYSQNDPKPPAAPPIKGANQMAGEAAKLGVTYTVGKEPALNFTLNSAEFTVARVNIQETAHAPRADEKLLLLNFSVHNPNKTEVSYDWSVLRFTVVDAENVNHENPEQLGDSGTRKDLFIELKPAQKIGAYTVIVVPAKGPIPKLIVQPADGSAVLRYDLRGAVKALAAPFADPEDKSGVTALAEVTAETGKFFPMSGFDVKVVKTEYSPGPLGEHEAGEGKRFFIATLALKNATAAKAGYDSGSFVPALLTADDEKAEWNQVFLKTARNEPAHGELKPGEEYTVRVVFSIPQDIDAKSFSFAEGESRVYSFDVQGTK